MDSIRLTDLLGNIPDVELNVEQSDKEIFGLKIDSRMVTNGDAFIAMVGFNQDARDYIDIALSSGATIVIAEQKDNQKYIEKYNNTQSVVWVDDLRSKVSLIACNFYGDPSRSLKAIGVTGTNGKTSCSFLIAKTLQKLHFECYLLGTLGIGQCSRLESCDNTTVDAISMQRVLAEAVDVGAQFASMEISSHGIDQDRAAAVKLHTAIFTNLTRDHLDYHGSMENYGKAKRKLFLSEELDNAVINMDDKFGRKLSKDKEIKANKWLVTTKLPTSGSNLNRWIWAEDVIYTLDGLHAKIYTPWGSGRLDSPLIGKFNLSNLLLVIAALGALLGNISPVLGALASVCSAPGRMQKVGNKNTPLAIVDYAHTPDALEQTLIAIREHCVGMIWCVFGCGGDRDSGKRGLMARVAEKLANKVVVTLDNPRTENFESIKNDIFSGFRCPEKAKYVEDREQAIEYAISRAMPGDVVLIAGKGHEDYQIIGTEKKTISDVDTAEKSIVRYLGESND